MKTKWLLYSGFFIPILFWVTIIVCGFMIGNYDHTRRLVSELGAIGTRSQHFFTTGLVLCSILSVFFIIGLYKTCKQAGLNVIPILIILTFSFSICGAALFPLPQKLHGILGMPAVILFLSPLLALFLWKSEQLSNIKLVSFLAFLVMSLGFLSYLPNVLGEYPGLKQRFFHLGWTAWFIYLSDGFLKLNKQKG